MAKKNTGKPFEKLVQEIYQALLNYDQPENGFKKINVEHNVTLNGKFGNTHQVDVYWEFMVADTTYSTVVEVKDWENPVKQEQMMAFVTKLNDIPGRPKGIFVSRNGFQEGAKKIASNYDITLIQISKEDSPILRVHLANTITHYDMPKVYVDEDWLHEDAMRAEAVRNLVPKRPFEEAQFINPLGQRISVYELMCMRATPYYYSPDYELHQIEIPLDGEWYWVSEDSRIPLVKIVDFTYRCYNASYHAELELSYKEFANYIVTDILNGKQHRYNSFMKAIHKNVEL